MTQSATAAPARSIRSMPANAAGDREAVGLAHFGVGQKLDHADAVAVGAECVAAQANFKVAANAASRALVTN